MIRKSEADAIPCSISKEWKRRTYIAVAKLFSCSEGRDILNIDVSSQGELVARYFADPVSEKYKGYLVQKSVTTRWKKIKLINLIQKAAGEPPILQTFQYRYVPEAHWEWSKGSEMLVRKFLRNGVDEWENSIESKRYYRGVETKHTRLQNMLNSIIRQTPAEFEAWAYEQCSEKIAIKVSSRELEAMGVYEYQCTDCGGKWYRERQYRNKRIVTCPHCGHELQVKKFARTEMKNFYLFQPCNDGSERWYVRYIRGYKMWESEKGWDLRLNDLVMQVVNAKGKYGRRYYHEGSGYTETHHMGMPKMERGYIYPDFGGAEEMMTDQQARCLRVLADRSIYVDAEECINAEDDPGIEYLLKGRFDRLAADIFSNPYTGRFKMGAQSIDAYLGIDRQRCFRLRQINGSFIELEWLRYEEKLGRKVSKEDMDFFTRYRINPNDTFNGTRLLLSQIPSPTQFRNYLQKQAEKSGDTIRQTITTYSDYYDMAKNQELDLTSPIFYKPKDLKAAHDECVRFAHKEEYEKIAKEKAEKFPKVPEILKSIHDKYTYEGKEFMIVAPSCIEDIIAEGRALGHCIDTADRYFDRIQNNVTYPVFLRWRRTPTQSWYTLEIEPDGSVRQQRTTGDVKREKDVKQYMPFILEWQKEVKKRLTAEDRDNAARSRKIRAEEYKDLREKKEPIRRGLLAGKLLVDVLESDLVEVV